MPVSRTDERVLLLAPVGKDAATMAELLRRQGFQIRICGNPAECSQLIGEGAGVLVLAEEALELPSASELVASLRGQPAWSELPVIILTSGGESRVATLLDLAASAAGAVTLLERPMSLVTLWRAVQVALRSRRRQYQVRDLITEQQSSREALEKRAHQLRVLYHLTDALSRAESLNQVYDSALNSILAALSCDRASLLLFDEAGVMRFRAWRGLSDQYRAAVEGHSPWKPGDRNAEPIFIEDVAAASFEEPLRRTIELEGIRALAFLPLQAHSRVTGKFMVYYNQPHRFDPEELRLAQTIARQVGFGLERKRAEEALRLSEEHYRTLVSQVKDYAIFRMDTDGKATTWNQGVRTVLGFEQEEFIGQDIAKAIFTAEDFAAGVPQRELQTAAAEGTANNDRWLRRKDGTRFFATGITTGLRDEAGKITGFSKVLRDITERKMAEEHLERTVTERTADLRSTNEQLEAFVYSIAHDLRAPLRSMIGYSQLLLDDYAAGLDPSAQQILKRIQASSEFMDKLLMDLLAFGRTARAELELGPVEVRAAWESALMQCATQIEQSNAQVATFEPLPTVRAHEATLGQILANLLSNAMKFVASGVQPQVRFRAESRGHLSRLWLEDNGIGIPPDQHERAFRVFERLHGSRYKGTGIGLSIVRKGVERMGGRVGLESTPGEGSRFWIELPKANQD